MFNTRLLSLIRKEFIQIVRDPRTLVLMFIMPVVQLFLLGYAATNDVRNVPLAVLDFDRTPASRALLDAYRAADYFQLHYEVSHERALQQLLDTNQARAGIIIPAGYAADLAAGRRAEIAFVIDGSDPTIAGTALAAATLIGQARSTGVVMERLAARGQARLFEPALEVHTQVWYNPDLVSAYYMVPALIGTILQMLTTVLTATAIVRERERGTIEQLIVTPIRSWELITGKLAPYILIAFIDTILILVIGMVVFHVPLNGSLALLMVLSGLFLMSTLGLGLFFSTIASTQQEAMLSAWFTMLPSIFLSGFFFPLAAMPPVLQAISYLIPLRYYLIIVRGIIIKGVGADALWPEIIALAVMAVVIMGGAALRFRKRLD
jgi:ABC-2 type transport system permease protein